MYYLVDVVLEVASALLPNYSVLSMPILRLLSTLRLTRIRAEVA